jgi:hypothetical protein
MSLFVVQAQYLNLWQTYHIESTCVVLLLGYSAASEFYVLTFQNTICSICVGHVNKNNSWIVGTRRILPPDTTYDDGMDRVFWNIGT